MAKAITADDWIDIIYDTFKMERMTFSIGLQKDKFLKRWEMQPTVVRGIVFSF